MLSVYILTTPEACGVVVVCKLVGSCSIETTVAVYSGICIESTLEGAFGIGYPCLRVFARIFRSFFLSAGF